MKYVYIMLKPVRYCLNTMVYLIKLPFKIIGLLGRAVFYRKAKPRRRFKHYKPSKHKHDNYQSQIDMLARKINELLLNDEAYNKQFNRFESSVEERITKFFKLNTTMVDKIKSIENRITESFKIDISTDKQLDKLEKKYEHILGCWNVYGDSIESLEAKVNKMLSENSKLTFKPLTKEEEVSLEIAKGECIWDDRTRDYPDEPDFQAEKKAMDKQIAKVKKRDEEFEANLSKNDKIRLNNMSSSTDVSKFNLNPEDDEEWEPITNKWLNDKA